jgi:hypothetical protein
VFNGPLGDNSQDLVRFFEAAPGVTPMEPGRNPATWMLDMIGAGTGGSKESITDFHVFYKQSALATSVQTKVRE